MSVLLPERKKPGELVYHRGENMDSSPFKKQMQWICEQDSPYVRNASGRACLVLYFFQFYLSLLNT